jgi:hypothetical protein
MSERNYKTDFNTETGIFTKTFKDDKGVLTVDVNALPDISRQYIMGYGITQILNDCHSQEKVLDDIIRISQNKAEDLMAGIIRRRAGEGLGLGVNLEILTQAVANTQLDGDLEKAKEALAKFIPGEDDDEETAKKKKSRLRAIRNFGEVRAEIDKLSGKKFEDLLA